MNKYSKRIDVNPPGLAQDPHSRRIMFLRLLKCFHKCHLYKETILSFWDSPLIFKVILASLKFKIWFEKQ
jgi:hypothetical protein